MLLSPVLLAIPNTRKGRQGAVNGGSLVHEKEQEELRCLYFVVALRGIEVGTTEICYNYGIHYWDVIIQ